MNIQLRLNKDSYNIHKHCLECERLQRYGIKTGHITGCSNYTGIHIAEKVLRKIFNNVIKAHVHDPYDFICGKGLKIDSKCSLLRMNHNKNEQWAFSINQNKHAEVFCLIALDNTLDDISIHPRPLYVWLIPGNTIIDKRPLNDRKSFSITPKTIDKISEFRKVEIEKKIVKCCKK